MLNGRDQSRRICGVKIKSRDSGLSRRDGRPSHSFLLGCTCFPCFSVCAARSLALRRERRAMWRQNALCGRRTCSEAPHVPGAAVAPYLPSAGEVERCSCGCRQRASAARSRDVIAHKLHRRHVARTRSFRADRWSGWCSGDIRLITFTGGGEWCRDLVQASSPRIRIPAIGGELRNSRHGIFSVPRGSRAAWRLGLLAVRPSWQGCRRRSWCC